MKKKAFYLILFAFILTFSFTSVFGNIWLLLTENGYEIPKESSIFTFEATKMNDGSGGWWIYGEDNEKYYALSTDSINSILFIDKLQSKKIENFDKFNYETWK